MSAAWRLLVRQVLAVVARYGAAPVSLAAGVAATVVLALSMSGTLGAWTASVRTDGNSSSSGTLTIQETGPGANPVVCNTTDGSGNGINKNAATCTGINHYGGATLVPNGSVSTTVTLKNTGTLAANSVTLTFAPCTQSNNTATGNTAGSATDLCDVLFMFVQVNINGTITPMTQNSISLSAANRTGSFSLPTLAAGTTASVYFGIGMSAATDNTYQGLTATQPITFQFGS